MTKFTIQDVKENQRFSALTQEESETISQLIDHCDKHQSKIIGFIETRKELLHKNFDRTSLMEYIELTSHFDKSNKFMVLLMKNLLEKFSRDIVRENMVEDFVASTKLKLELFDGDVDKVAECIENYLRCGVVTPMAQTWKERVEEIEEGKIIYYEPKAERTI